MKGRVIILDFGSQYTQLIARRVRELNVYGEIIPYNKAFELDESLAAVILSGSPFSVLDPEALQFDLNRIIGKIPILCICYGAQYTAQVLGGEVMSAQKREYGKANLSRVLKSDPILKQIEPNTQVWMSHGDTIIKIPDQFDLIAGTDNIDVAIFRSKPNTYDSTIYCFQFHPEVSHTLLGKQFLQNFLFDIAGCVPDWTPASFIESTIKELKEKIGTEHVLMGLSGGVDSTVAAVLLHHAIGEQLICFFIDNGLLRKNEFEQVLASYQDIGLNIVGIDASSQFIQALEDIKDPEQKRKIIGRIFIEVFEAEAAKLNNVSWLGQGTIYPDVIESVSVHGPSVTIKSHHNVGGLPDRLNLKIIEPLRSLFKDEVRKVGKELQIAPKIIGRHPFPGPGLAIRILGAITQDKVALLQEADDIFIRKLREYDHYDQVWQAGCILLPVRSVGVMGDERTYEFTVALRAVNSVDGMTAEWSRLPYEFLAEVSSEIINQVKGINRVVYDISTKPPSTIEWE